MKNYLFYTLPLLSLFLLSSCKMDFGEKALNFVQRDLSYLSKELTQKDLKIRIPHAYETGVEEIAFMENNLSNTLDDVYSNVKSYTENRLSDPVTKEQMIQDLLFAKKFMPLLIEIKKQIELAEYKLNILDHLCDESYLKKTEIPNLSLTLPLQSLENSKDIINSLKVSYTASLLIGNGALEGKAKEDLLEGGETTAAAAILTMAINLLSGGLTTSAFALIFSGITAGLNAAVYFIAKEEIEEQKEMLMHAIAIIPQNIYPAEKVVIEAREHCLLTQFAHSEALENSKKNIQQIHLTWGKVYTLYQSFYQYSQKNLFPELVSEVMTRDLDDKSLSSFDGSAVKKIESQRHDFFHSLLQYHRLKKIEDPELYLKELFSVREKFKKLRRLYQSKLEMNLPISLKSNIEKLLANTNHYLSLMSQGENHE